MIDSPPVVVPAGRTVIPPHRTEEVPPVPRRIGGFSRETALNVAGATLFTLCVTVMLFGRLGPLSGPVGAVIVAYFLFLGSYATLVSLSDDGPVVRNAVMTVVITSTAFIAVGALACVVLFVALKGWPALHHLNFYTQDLSSAGPQAPLNVGGVQHAIVGSLWMVAIALAITTPMGILCAFYLNEARGRAPAIVRTVVEAMTALPSVLAGLFVFATYILTLHYEKSGLAAAFALSVEMLPIIIRASDVVLRLVPGNLKEASAALGAPQWRTALNVTLPTARSGLVTGIILATARGMGETAPVLLTAGYTTYFNSNPVHGPMVSLPLVAFELVRTGEPQYVVRGFAAATLLLLIVLVLFVLARAVGGRGPGNLSASQLRRAMRMSARDAQRFLATAPPVIDLAMLE